VTGGMLQGLVVKRLLHQVGQKRGTTYQLPGPGRLSHPIENSSHKGGSSQKPAEDSLHKLESLTEEQRMQLDVIAAPAFMGSRLSLLPEESLQRLRVRFGVDVEKLGPVEVQALVTADAEGSVDNPRLREICDEHPADLSKLLQGLVATGFLVQKGQRRWSYYELPPDSGHNDEGTPDTTDTNSGHSGTATPDISDPELGRCPVGSGRLRRSVVVLGEPGDGYHPV